MVCSLHRSISCTCFIFGKIFSTMCSFLYFLWVCILHRTVSQIFCLVVCPTLFSWTLILMILINGEMPSLASPTTSNHLLSSNPRLNQRWRGDAAAPPAKPVIGGKIFQNCVTSLTLAHAFKVLLNSWKISNSDFSRWKNLLNYEEKLMSTVHSCVGVDEVSWDLMTIMV